MARRHAAAPAHPLFHSFVKEFVLLCGLGLLVAVALVPARHLELVRELDRAASDVIMREMTLERMGSHQLAGPRFIFVDIGDATCEHWAQQADLDCNRAFATPHPRLKALVDAVAGSASGPALVVIDIELSRTRADVAGARLDDEALCRSLVQLARKTPVVIARPVTKLDVDYAWSTMLDGRVKTAVPCARELGALAPGASNLWTGSDVVMQDQPGGVVRSVYAWQTVVDRQTGAPVRLAGMALLGAALLEPSTNRQVLACAFPGSVEGTGSCPATSLRIGERSLSLSEPNRIDRIAFEVPYRDKRGPDGAAYGYSPSLIDTVDPDELSARLRTTPDLFKGAVVVIGGSYAASGDLFRTPLSSELPGAMVHVNAINAYATGALIRDHNEWPMELVLVILAAFVGASSHTLGHALGHRFGVVGGHLCRILIVLTGVVIAVALVLGVAMNSAFGILARTNGYVAAVTPALAVALEGAGSVIHLLRQLWPEPATATARAKSRRRGG